MDISANSNIKAQYISVLNSQLTKTIIPKRDIKKIALLWRVSKIFTCKLFFVLLILLRSGINERGFASKANGYFCDTCASKMATVPCGNSSNKK